MASPRNETYRQQRGTAIIVALFIMSLAASIAVAMMVRLHVDIRRTELILNSDQAHLYAEGSVLWAIDQLNNDLKLQRQGQLIDKMPIQSPIKNQNGFQITSTIYDAQALFNINTLTDFKNTSSFALLIKAVNPTLEPTVVNQLVIAIHDWLAPSASAASDNAYTKMKPPYRPAHRRMVSTSELLLVNQMTPELYAQLEPYIIALPTYITGEDESKINVSTAPWPIFMTLSPTLNSESAKAIVAHRLTTPFLTSGDFTKLDIVINNHLESGKMTVQSNYFLVKTNVKVGQQNIVLYTLLMRGLKDNKPATSILWQTEGTL